MDSLTDYLILGIMVLFLILSMVISEYSDKIVDLTQCETELNRSLTNPIIQKVYVKEVCINEPLYVVTINQTWETFVPYTDPDGRGGGLKPDKSKVKVETINMTLKEIQSWKPSLGFPDWDNNNPIKTSEEIVSMKETNQTKEVCHYEEVLK